MLKLRILSAFIGLLILAVVFIFFDTIIFNAAICVVGIFAVSELLLAVNCSKPRSLFVLSLSFAALIPFIQEPGMHAVIPQILFGLVLLLFAILLGNHQSLRFEQTAMVFFFSVFVPLFFSSAVFIRNAFGPQIGGLYVLWALGAAWLSDTGAYFVGIAIGKRKLAPVISPKKTVEGAVGGVIVSSVFMCVIAFFYGLLMEFLGTPIAVSYPLMLILTPFFSVAGMLGDLSASVIKRQFGVKDYGRIMPGHGGVMDRFDSVLFTMPAVFIVVGNIAVVTLR